jgi:hypothetical protein
MATTTLDGDVHITGNVTVGGSLPEYQRTNLAQEGTMLFPLPVTGFRVWDAFATVLPGTPASDDLGLVGGTVGTDFPMISTGDVKALGTTTRKARCIFQLPPEYVTGQSVFIRAFAGMKTTVSDGACTIDFSVYESGITTSGSLVAGADLVTTAATSIKFLSWANYDFAITATDLAAGDWLDILMTIAVTDAATGTAVIAACRPSISCTIKG